MWSSLPYLLQLQYFQLFQHEDCFLLQQRMYFDCLQMLCFHLFCSHLCLPNLELRLHLFSIYISYPKFFSKHLFYKQTFIVCIPYKRCPVPVLLKSCPVKEVFTSIRFAYVCYYSNFVIINFKYSAKLK